MMRRDRGDRINFDLLLAEIALWNLRWRAVASRPQHLNDVHLHFTIQRAPLLKVKCLSQFKHTIDHLLVLIFGLYTAEVLVRDHAEFKCYKLRLLVLLQSQLFLVKVILILDFILAIHYFAKIRVEVLKVVDVKVLRERWFYWRLLYLINNLCGQSYEKFGSDAQLTCGGTFPAHLLNDLFANAES